MLQGRPVAAQPIASGGARRGAADALGPLRANVRPANRGGEAGRVPAMTPRRP